MKITLKNKRIKNLTRKGTLLLPSLLFFFVFLLAPTEIAHAGWAEIGSSIVDGFVSLMDTIFGNIFRLLMWVVSLAASLFTSLGSQALDMAIRYAINGDNLDISGVITGWTIFRDLVNMLFIFILLYVAIMTILQASGANTKKTLANLIIVGLLMNFSFFLTAFVIDIGNALSVIIYEAVTPGNSSIGGILTDRMKLSLLKDAVSNASPFKIGLAHLMNTVFFLVAGFVFFAGAALFITRHISLLFVLILSPVAFAASILPSTKKHFSKWFSTLIGNTFVAPVYLLMIAVTMAIASAPDLLTSAKENSVQIGASGQIASPFISVDGLLMNYIVIIGFMIGSLIVAKSMAGSLVSMTSKAVGGAIGVGGAVGGFVGRNTMGRRAAKRLANKGDEWRAMRDDKNASKAQRMGARMKLASAKTQANASFDVRSGKVAKAVGGAAGSVYGAAGVSVNAGRAGGQGGHQKVLDGRFKEEKKEMDYIKDDKKAMTEARDKLENDPGLASRKAKHKITRDDLGAHEKVMREHSKVNTDKLSGYKRVDHFAKTKELDKKRKTLAEKEAAARNVVETRKRRLSAVTDRRMDVAKDKDEKTLKTRKQTFIDDTVKKRWWDTVNAKVLGGRLEKELNKSEDQKRQDTFLQAIKDSQSSSSSTSGAKKASEALSSMFGSGEENSK